MEDWATLLQEEQVRLIRKWQKDAIRNQELADIMRELLRERGV